MCDPISMMTAMAAVSTAATAASVMSTRAQGKAAADAAKQAAEADYNALSLQARQISEKGTQEGLAVKRAAMVTRGTLLASQSASGVQGASPFRELLNVRLKEQEALAAVEGNVGNALMQNRADMEKIRATAAGRINTAYASMPSGALAGLQIASAGLQGAAVGYDLGGQIQKGKK